MINEALILLGGKGTRIRALHPDRPKALINVAGKPFIEWQLAQLARHGISKVHLAAGYRAEQIRKWIKSRGNPFTPPGREQPISISMSEETSPLGTGGGLKMAAPWLTGECFWIINGDSLAPNLDLKAMALAYMASDPRQWGIRNRLQTEEIVARNIMMAVVPAVESERFGSVILDSSSHVIAFDEKFRRGSGWINAGIYLMDRTALAALPDDSSFSLEENVFPNWAGISRLRAFVSPPPLLDMGTPEGFRAMENYISAHQLR